jgi:hypothetical protein
MDYNVLLVLLKGGITCVGTYVCENTYQCSLGVRKTLRSKNQHLCSIVANNVHKLVLKALEMLIILIVESSAEHVE